MLKRGQAAFEFLMTYGWAILAVLITIAALAYFGVLNLNRFSPAYCNLGPGFSCKEFTVTNVEAYVKVVNGIGSSLSQFDLTLPNCGTGSAVNGLNDGESELILIPNCAYTDLKRIIGDITATYKESNKQLTKTRTGNIKTDIYPNLVKNPSFEFDLNADGMPDNWQKDPPGWSPSSFEVSTTNAVDGKYSFHINKVLAYGVFTQLRTNAFGVPRAERIQVKPNTRYMVEATVTGDTSCSGLNNNGFQLVPKCQNMAQTSTCSEALAGDQFIYEIISRDYRLLANDPPGITKRLWYKIRTIADGEIRGIETCSRTVDCWIDLQFDAEGGEECLGEVYIDNVRFYEL